MLGFKLVHVGKKAPASKRSPTQQSQNYDDIILTHSSLQEHALEEEKSSWRPSEHMRQ